MQLVISDTFIEDLLSLKGSTTLFLESAKGLMMSVQLESQSENTEAGRCIIRRATRLFFQSAQQPALYCLSYLLKNELTAMEYHTLKAGVIPIGKLFLQFNDRVEIKKTNISRSLETHADIARLLNVNSDLVYKKEYDYWIGRRRIGQIIEFFNKESLSRL
jgi:hypothetical protein